MNTPVAVRISVPPEKGGQDGIVRAAREMVAIANHMPGYIFHEAEEERGHVRSYVLYWTDVESIDAWRERLYQSGLKKYSPEAWSTFADMEIVAGRTLRPADVETRPPKTILQRRAASLWGAFSLVKKVDAA